MDSAIDTVLLAADDMVHEIRRMQDIMASVDADVFDAVIQRYEDAKMGLAAVRTLALQDGRPGAAPGRSTTIHPGSSPWFTKGTI